MKQTDTNKVREIMRYLRGLEYHQLACRDERCLVRQKLEEYGADYLGAGAYSHVYRLGKLVIKIASQDLSVLKNKLRHPLFKKYAPTIYWMHETGKVLVCKFVKYIREEKWELHEKAEERFKKLMRAAGFEADDLHRGNLVRVGRKWCIIDYGCWTGN